MVSEIFKLARIAHGVFLRLLLLRFSKETYVEVGMQCSSPPVSHHSSDCLLMHIVHAFMHYVDIL